MKRNLRIQQNLADHKLFMDLYEMRGMTHEAASAKALNTLKAYQDGAQWAVEEMLDAIRAAQEPKFGGWVRA